MPKASYEARRPQRVPPPAGPLQVNFCRNPACDNFGRPPGNSHGGSKAAKDEPPYVMSGGGGSLPPTAICKACNESFALKSNHGVAEEVARLTNYLQPPPEPTCPTEGCAHQAKGVRSHPDGYQRFGHTSAGSHRYRCKACLRLFAIAASATPRQKRSDVNALVFRLLVNKMPMRRICETAGIGPQTLYTKLRFLSERTRVFTRKHEAPLLEGRALPSLLLSTDRQDYLINWGTSADRRNIRLHGIGTADNRSSFVFGMHIDYDSSLDPGNVEMEALECGDYGIVQPFRRFARVWLKRDWTAENVLLRQRHHRASHTGVSSSELTADDGPRHWADDTKLPGRGMKVRSDYSMMAHMQIVARMTSGSPHVALYLDQDSGLRSATHVAFENRIRVGSVDTFHVRINKDMTIDQKGLVVAQAAQRMAKFTQARRITAKEGPQRMLEEALAQRGFRPRWQDRWMTHPIPDGSEPEKELLHLTDRPELTDARRAAMHLWGSLRGIDRFFMIVRRRQSLLERPISSASAAGRVFYGNNPYRPWVVESVLDLLRVTYNYHHRGQDQRTPAERLGLTTRAYSLEDILGG